MAKKALATDDDVRREVDHLLGAFAAAEGTAADDVDEGDSFADDEVTPPRAQTHSAPSAGADALWPAGRASKRK